MRAPARLAPLKSVAGKSAMMRAPERFAPAKFGLSLTWPPRTTGPRMLLLERLAPRKLVAISQALLRGAAARLAPDRFAPTSLLANRFVPARLARLKSR